MDYRERQLMEQDGDVILFDPPVGKDMLQECFSFEVVPGSLTEEDTKEGKRSYLEGRLGLVDKATANKRLYTRKLMEREIAKKLSDMKSKKIYGELDHPGDGKTKLSRASHFVLGANVNENDEIFGKLEFIPGTPNGDIALSIARAGGTLGVSSRGFGTVVPDAKGNLVVQEDYQLVTWDIVADPANAGAHPNFVVEEKETVMDLEKLNKEHPEILEALKVQLRKEIEPESREHAREALREELEGQLKEVGEKIREEAVEQAREEAENDPDVAGAKVIVEQLKEIVGPFVLGEDGNEVIVQLKERIGKLEGTIADQDAIIAEQKDQMETIATVATELGYKLYLERTLGEDADAIIKELGGVSEFQSLDALKEAVSAILERIESVEEDKSKYKDEILKREKEIEKRDREIEALREQREQALGIGAKMGIRAYLEKCISGHPRAIGIRKYVLEADPDTKTEVDGLIESYDKEHPLSDEYLKIRKGISKPRLTEDLSSLTPKTGISDIMGVPMGELDSRTKMIS